MKKLTLFFSAMLLACATNLWADEVTLWSPSNPYTASTTPATKGVVSFVNSANNSYNNPTRLYSGNTFTISIANGYKITKIVATCSSADYASAFGGTSVDLTGTGTCASNRTVATSSPFTTTMQVLSLSEL